MALAQGLQQLLLSSFHRAGRGLLQQNRSLLQLCSYPEQHAVYATAARAALQGQGSSQVSTSALESNVPSTSGGEGGGSWAAPWPWVATDRPQSLPLHIAGSGRPPPIALDAALQQLQASASSSPTHSIDVAIRFHLDPRRSDHLVRGSVVLPYGTGKAVRVAVFAQGEAAELAKQLGADIIGDDALIKEIIDSNGAAIRFDKLIATPDFMKPLAKAGRVLGPKGLMPNPKLGTLTTDVAKALRETRQGRLDYRLGKDAMVRAAVGKVSMPQQQLLANLGGLFHSLLDTRPKGLPGQGLQGYLAAVTLRSSQSKGQRVTLESCEAAVPLFMKVAGITDEATEGQAAGGKQ